MKAKTDGAFKFKKNLTIKLSWKVVHLACEQYYWSKLWGQYDLKKKNYFPSIHQGILIKSRFSEEY